MAVCSSYADADSGCLRLGREPESVRLTDRQRVIEEAQALQASAHSRLTERPTRVAPGHLLFLDYVDVSEAPGRSAPALSAARSSSAAAAFIDCSAEQLHKIATLCGAMTSPTTQVVPPREHTKQSESGSANIAIEKLGPGEYA